jgi:site-specific recombinase XerD
MRFSELATDYVRSMAVKGKSPRTCENYDLAYGQFRAFLQSRGLADDLRHFNGETCGEFAEYLATGGNKASSVNTKLAALASLARYGMRSKQRGKDKYILTENPIERVERPKAKKPREKYLYRDEIRAMFSVATAYERLTLTLLFETNLRVSALVNANVGDLSLDGDRVLLSVVEKGDNPDTFVLSPEVAEPLLETLKLREAKATEPLLVNQGNRRFTRTHFSDMVARIARRAGITRIPVRAHMFARHSPASIAGQNGANVFEIAAMLRHRDANTAKRYVHGVTADAARAKVRELVEETK